MNPARDRCDRGNPILAAARSIAAVILLLPGIAISYLH
jgi:hypothetical protein